MISQEAIKNALEYDPVTGVFLWKVAPKRGLSRVGQVAGTLHKMRGDITITIDQVRYKAHRLAWIYVHGSLPDELEIDHEDNDPSNNAIANLRIASSSQNKFNTRRRKDNTSGAKGIVWRKDISKWTARCTLFGKTHHLGTFIDLRDAESAVQQYRQQHHNEFANHGG